MRKKEIFWFIGTIILVLLLNLIILGSDSLNSDAVLDINVHDTYFVLPKSHFLILLSIFTFFVVYLIRIIITKFKNIIVSLIFIITNIILIIVITQIISLVDAFTQIGGTTEYPPLSGGTVTTTGNGFRLYSNGLVIIQLLLIFLLVISGIKTGMNYNRKK